MTDEAPIPAATVVIMREAAEGPPELLMVERAAAMAFAGGALVFPGGRVDPGDVALAQLIGPDDVDEASARIAAIREAIEEVGVTIGLGGDLEPSARDDLRASLHAGSEIGAALAAGGVSLDLAALVPFARWLPRGVTHRIFDTRFYLAAWPEGAPEPGVDATENTRLSWISARDALTQADAGTVRIIFPTRRNLERLAQFASFADAAAHARATEQRTIIPWIEERDDGRYLCIPDDLGYPVTSEALATAIRA